MEATAASKALVLTATNLKVTLKQELACDTQEDDALAIDAKLLAGMLEKLPSDTVELRRDPGVPRLNIRSTSGVKMPDTMCLSGSGAVSPRRRFPL